MRREVNRSGMICEVNQGRELASESAAVIVSKVHCERHRVNARRSKCKRCAVMSACAATTGQVVSVR